MVLGVSRKLLYSKSPNFTIAKWFQNQIQIDFYNEAERVAARNLLNFLSFYPGLILTFIADSENSKNGVIASDLDKRHRQKIRRTRNAIKGTTKRGIS